MTREAKQDFDRDCVRWYDSMLGQLDDVEARVEQLTQELEKAVDFILGGGLTPEEKKKWRKGLSPQEQVRRAIASTSGMIAT